MKRAIELAKQAASLGEVPVGAVIVKNGEIIAEGKNEREAKQMTTAHAEIIAINEASRKLNSWRLDGASIYVTLEPCAMCAGAIANARLDEVVFGAFDKNAGFADSRANTFSLLPDSKVNVYAGICEDECTKLLTDFFKAVREK